MPKGYDFSGWATRFGIKCSDGRTITKGAFDDCDGKTVPLVYSHVHDNISNVIGHADLEVRPEGVYSYNYLNNTSGGKDAREQLRNGDLKYLSIYANRLTERNGSVLHGDIKEVSLVLAGANPGAMIDVPYIEHGDYDNLDFEGIIYNSDDDPIELAHSDDTNNKSNDGDSDKTIEDILDTLNPEQKKAVAFIISQLSEDDDDDDDDGEMSHSDDMSVQDVIDTMSDAQIDALNKVLNIVNGSESKDSISHADGGSIEDVINTMNSQQKDVMYYLLAEEAKGTEFDVDDEDEDEADDDDDYANEGDEDADSDGSGEEGESTGMKHNVFDNDERTGNYLSQGDLDAIFADAKRCGSLADAVAYHQTEGVLAHADDDLPVTMTADYGIDRIDWLFPEAKYVNNMPPEFLKRETDWVQKVMGKVHHTPFSRIKSMFANITMEEARARGYTKGNLKKEEVFTLLRRSTDPQTVYKKQKLDKDDITDITDFDVVSWIKGEMRLMLDEELARAFLIGDGRSTASEDHISHDHIRPIWTDKELYTVRINVPKGGDLSETAKNTIDAAIRGRKYYKGSGQPTLFTTEDWVTEMLLLEDGINHKLYKSVAELATTMRVSEIVTVPVMENQVNPDNGKTLIGLIVNLADYNVGADKGGSVDMFDDFDIDYNQYKYLIETRCSGALIKPYSALALEYTA